MKNLISAFIESYNVMYVGFMFYYVYEGNWTTDKIMNFSFLSIMYLGFILDKNKK